MTVVPVENCAAAGAQFLGEVLYHRFVVLRQIQLRPPYPEVERQDGDHAVALGIHAEQLLHLAACLSPALCRIYTVNLRVTNG